MRLAELFVEITGRSAQFDRSIRNVQRSLTSTQALAGAAALGIAGAFAGIGAAGAKAAIDLETAFSKVRKTTGLTGEELETLKDRLKSMSINLAGSSLSDLTEVAAIAGRLGITAVGDIEAFTAAVAKIRIAMDDIPADEAANSIAKILHVFNLGTDQALSLASAVNKLDDTSTASGREILDVTRRLSGMASTLGMTADEATALAATLLDAGVSVEVAGTSFTQVMAKMAAEPATFAAVARKSTQEFAATLKKSPIRAIKELALGLQSLSPAARIAALGELGLEGTRVESSMLQLVNTIDKLDVNLAAANSEMRTHASIQREVAVQAGTTKAQLEVFHNRLSIAADKVGQKVLPHLNSLLDGLGKVGDAFEDLSNTSFAQEYLQNLSKQFGIAGVSAETFWDDMAFSVRNFDLLLASGAAHVMGWGESVGVAFGFVRDTGASVLEWLGGTFQSVWTATIHNLGLVFHNFANAVGTVWNNVVGGISEGLNVIRRLAEHPIENLLHADLLRQRTTQYIHEAIGNTKAKSQSLPGWEGTPQIPTIPGFKMPPLPKFPDITPTLDNLTGQMAGREAAAKGRRRAFDQPVPTGKKVPGMPGGGAGGEFGGLGAEKRRTEMMGLEAFAKDLLTKGFKKDDATKAAETTAKNSGQSLTYMQRLAEAMDRIAKHGVAARAYGRS